MTRGWSLLPHSLKLTLLWLLLPGLVGVLAIDILSAYQALRGATDRAYDRALLGSVRAIENGVTIERGQVQVNVPYVALSMFESTAQSNVYYRVAFDRGAGAPAEPAPPGSGDPPLRISAEAPGTLPPPFITPLNAAAVSELAKNSFVFVKAFSVRSPFVMKNS